MPKPRRLVFEGLSARLSFLKLRKTLSCVKRTHRARRVAGQREQAAGSLSPSLSLSLSRDATRLVEGQSAQSLPRAAGDDVDAARPSIAAVALGVQRRYRFEILVSNLDTECVVDEFRGFGRSRELETCASRRLAALFRSTSRSLPHQRDWTLERPSMRVEKLYCRWGQVALGFRHGTALGACIPRRLFEEGGVVNRSRIVRP